MSALTYKWGPFDPKDLIPNECCIKLHDRRWYLYFCFEHVAGARKGERETRHIPISPNSDPRSESYHTWGLKRAPGGWQITPSILCWDYEPDPNHLDDRSKDIRVEVWHETPLLVNVPDGEPWQSGA